MVKGVQKSTNSKVAIKIIQKNKKNMEEKKNSFLEEVHILQKLDHPNIVRILESVNPNVALYPFKGPLLQ